jgi:hypothetical protein
VYGVKTEDLITMLATGIDPVDSTRAAARRLAILTTAGACAVAFVSLALGLNPRLGAALNAPQFWLREAFCAGLALSGFALTLRVARPGMRLGILPAGMGLIVLVMWIVAGCSLFGIPPAARSRAIVGATAAVCPWLITITAAPLLLALWWVLRGLAPTRLRLAGSIAGFTAGSMGALVYTLHCPELAPPFVATWYVIGMLIPSCVGALLAPRLLRW